MKRNVNHMINYTQKTYCSNISDDIVLIGKNDYFKEGDEVSVIRYPTDGKILHLKVRINNNLTNQIVLSKNNYEKLDCDPEFYSITVYE